jgi:hypothetical protein
MSRPQKNSYDFDRSFYVLASEVTAAIEVSRDGSDQKAQVEELMRAEILFKGTILKYKQSTEIYKRFLQHIRIRQKNILSARPYFRESAITFSKKITPSIKAEDIQTLQTFSINFQLIKFIKDHWLGPFPKKAIQLYERVQIARERLITLNMPLAINRAKIFYKSTPKGHLSLMDMIGICSLGLIAGIDKYCGVYRSVFRSVLIGRQVGNLIDEYSSTMLHFYPSDKRILYKAHSIRGRQGVDDVKVLTEAVKDAFKADALAGKSVPKTKIDVGELAGLLSAASTVSADNASVNDEGERFGVYDYTSDEDENIEDNYIKREETNDLLTLARKLPILHRKVLRLKGVKI